jgi:hypothetical protein
MMRLREFLETRIDVFLAPSACLLVETILALFPERACVFHQRISVKSTKDLDEVYYASGGEKFTLLGYAGERGKDRRMIVLTSHGVGCVKILSGDGEDGFL